MGNDSHEDKGQLARDFELEFPGELNLALNVVRNWKGSVNDPEAGLAEALSRGWNLDQPLVEDFVRRAKRLLKRDAQKAQHRNPDTEPTGPLPPPP